MRADLVVLATPGLDEDLRLVKGVEDLSVEQFVPQYPFSHELARPIHSPSRSVGFHLREGQKAGILLSLRSRLATTRRGAEIEQAAFRYA